MGTNRKLAQEWVWQTIKTAKQIEMDGGKWLVVSELPSELSEEILSVGLAIRHDCWFLIGRWSISVLRLPLYVQSADQEDLCLARYSGRQRRMLGFLWSKFSKALGKTYSDKAKIQLLQDMQEFAESDIERAMDEFLATDDAGIYSPENFFRAVLSRQVEKARALAIESGSLSAGVDAQKPPDLRDLEARSGRIQDRISEWSAQNPSAPADEMIAAIRQIEQDDR